MGMTLRTTEDIYIMIKEGRIASMKDRLAQYEKFRLGRRIYIGDSTEPIDVDAPTTHSYIFLYSFRQSTPHPTHNFGIISVYTLPLQN